MTLHNDFFKKGSKHECLAPAGFSKTSHGFKNDTEQLNAIPITAQQG